MLEHCSISLFYPLNYLCQISHYHNLKFEKVQLCQCGVKVFHENGQFVFEIVEINQRKRFNERISHKVKVEWVIVCAIACEKNWHWYFDAFPVVLLSTEINKINVGKMEIILGAPETKRLIVSFIIPKLWWVCVK